MLAQQVTILMAMPQAQRWVEVTGVILHCYLLQLLAEEAVVLLTVSQGLLGVLAVAEDAGVHLPVVQVLPVKVTPVEQERLQALRQTVLVAEAGLVRQAVPGQLAVTEVLAYSGLTEITTQVEAVGQYTQAVLPALAVLVAVVMEPQETP